MALLLIIPLSAQLCKPNTVPLKFEDGLAIQGFARTSGENSTEKNHDNDYNNSDK